MDDLFRWLGNCGRKLVLLPDHPEATMKIHFYILVSIMGYRKGQLPAHLAGLLQPECCCDVGLWATE